MRLVSCHSAVQLLLLLCNAINHHILGVCVNLFFNFYLISQLFRPILLFNFGRFPPYTIIPTYTTLWNVRVPQMQHPLPIPLFWILISNILGFHIFEIAQIMQTVKAVGKSYFINTTSTRCVNPLLQITCQNAIGRQETPRSKEEGSCKTSRPAQELEGKDR